MSGALTSVRSGSILSTGSNVAGSKLKSVSAKYCAKSKFSSMSVLSKSLLNGKLSSSYRKAKIRCGRAWTQKNEVLTTSGSMPLKLSC